MDSVHPRSALWSAFRVGVPTMGRMIRRCIGAGTCVVCAGAFLSIALATSAAVAEDIPLGEPPAERVANESEIEEKASEIVEKAKEVGEDAGNAIEKGAEAVNDAVKGAVKDAGDALTDSKESSASESSAYTSDKTPSDKTPSGDAEPAATKADGSNTAPQPSTAIPPRRAATSTPSRTPGVQYRLVQRFDPRTGRRFYVRVPVRVTPTPATRRTAPALPNRVGQVATAEQLAQQTWVEVLPDGRRILHRPKAAPRPASGSAKSEGTSPEAPAAKKSPPPTLSASDTPPALGGDAPNTGGDAVAPDAAAEVDTTPTEGGFPKPEDDSDAPDAGSNPFDPVDESAHAADPESGTPVPPIAEPLSPGATESVADDSEAKDPAEASPPAKNLPIPGSSADLGTVPGLKKPLAPPPVEPKNDDPTSYGDPRHVGSGGFEDVGPPSSPPEPAEEPSSGDPIWEPSESDTSSGDVPNEPKAASSTPENNGDDEIWAPAADAPGSFEDIGGAPEPAPRTSTPRASLEARVQEHVTLLRDRPGSAGITAYPGSLILRAPTDVALEPRSKACVIAFYDDTSRGSANFAADVLPVLANYRDEIDFVAIDANSTAKNSPAEERVMRRYKQTVPGLVVLPPNRDDPRIFNNRYTADDIEEALELAVRSRTSPAPRVPGGDPAKPWRPEDTPPTVSEPKNPTGNLVGEEIRTTARAHADELRRNAGDAGLVGYPRSLLRTTQPASILERGQRPLVILFYDDSAKASDRQAAEFLPLLIRRSDDIDLILIDVSTKAEWNAVEQKIVRTYYMSYVPTTVVLTSRRAPVRSWYHLVRARDLERAINEAARK